MYRERFRTISFTSLSLKRTLVDELFHIFNLATLRNFAVSNGIYFTKAVGYLTLQESFLRRFVEFFQHAWCEHLYRKLNFPGK